MNGGQNERTIEKLVDAPQWLCHPFMSRSATIWRAFIRCLWHATQQATPPTATMLDRQSGRRGPFFPISDPCFVASLSRQVTKRANRFHSSVLQREKKAGHLLRGLQQCHLHEWLQTTPINPHSHQAT